MKEFWKFQPILLLAVASISFGQIDSLKQLDTMFVTATRTSKECASVPYSVSLITGDDMKMQYMARTLPEAMKATPGVMVQKTAYGQGSPYIRGFTGMRTLFLIDGVRLNNSTFRDGPNQYWNTVDQYSVSSLETVRGPGAMLYGSDAVGGVVQALTPELFSGGGDARPFRSRMYYRYASAEQSNVGRMELDGNLRNMLGYHLGFSPKFFGDLRAGNSVGVQPKTGYDEFNGDVKFEFLPHENSKLTVLHQQNYQNDVWRTHKTMYGISWEGTTVTDSTASKYESRRTADQARRLTYIQLNTGSLGGVSDALTCNVSFQQQDEVGDRITVKKSSTGRSSKRELTGTDVNTAGLWVQSDKKTIIGTMTAGFDWYNDWVGSYKREYNESDSLVAEYVQGPVADDAMYSMAGIYLQDDVTLFDRLNLIAGYRFNYSRADAEKVQDPLTSTRVSLKESWNKGVGSVRLLWSVDKNRHVKLFSGVSQSFRAPNLSDLTRFDMAMTNELEVPSPDLEPETFLISELGIKSSWSLVNFEIGGFYTRISNLIIRTPTGVIAPDGSIEVTKKNSGEGYVAGFEAMVAGSVAKMFQVSGWVSYQYGALSTYPTSEAVLVEEPVSRLMPLTAYGSVRFQKNPWPWWVEMTVTGADRQDRLSTLDKLDTQRIPPGGTPGYVVAGLHGGFKFARFVSLSAGVENITDEDYRIHGSGLNEAGRSIVAALEIRL